MCVCDIVDELMVFVNRAAAVMHQTSCILSPVHNSLLLRLTNL